MIGAFLPLWSAAHSKTEAYPWPNFDLGLYVNQGKNNPKTLNEFRQLLKTQGFYFKGTVIEDYHDPSDMAEPIEGLRKFIYTNGHDTVMLWMEDSEAEDGPVLIVDISSPDFEILNYDEFEDYPLETYLGRYGYRFYTALEGPTIYENASQDTPCIETYGISIFLFPNCKEYILPTEED